MKLELNVRNNLPNDNDFDVLSHFDYWFSFYKGNTTFSTEENVIKHFLFFKNRKNIGNEIKSLIRYYSKSNTKVLASNVLYTFDNVVRVYTFIE